VDELKRDGIIDKGMIPKMDSAVTAIRSGVEKVSLVDGRVPHSVLLESFHGCRCGDRGCWFIANTQLSKTSGSRHLHWCLG